MRTFRSRSATVGIAAALAVCCVAGSFLLPSGTARAAGACQDFYFISARGSGQSYSGLHDLSSSPETQAVLAGMYSAYTSAHRTPNFTVYNIDYPARPVPPMLGALALAAANPTNAPLNATARWAVANYLDGERKAETGIDATVKTIVAQCPSASVVLAGYSQGALAVHNYLLSTASTNISGAVLVADPERMPSSKVKNYGNAAGGESSYGVCPVLDRLPAFGRPSCRPDYLKSEEVPNRLLSVTAQVCNGTDSICDTSLDVRPADPWGDFERLAAGSFDLHMNCKAYCGGTSRLPGNVIGHRLLKQTPTPLPPAGPSTPVRSAPMVAPARGAPGAIVNVTMSAVCPAASPKARDGSHGVGARMALVDSAGKSLLDIGFNDITGPDPAKAPAHFSFTVPGAAPGAYTVQTRCVEEESREYGDNVVDTRVDPPVPFVVSSAP